MRTTFRLLLQKSEDDKLVSTKDKIISSGVYYSLETRYGLKTKRDEPNFKLISKIYYLREKEKMAFADISRKFKISNNRARALYTSAKYFKSIGDLK